MNGQFMEVHLQLIAGPGRNTTVIPVDRLRRDAVRRGVSGLGLCVVGHHFKHSIEQSNCRIGLMNTLLVSSPHLLWILGGRGLIQKWNAFKYKEKCYAGRDSAQG